MKLSNETIGLLIAMAALLAVVWHVAKTDQAAATVERPGIETAPAPE